MEYMEEKEVKFLNINPTLIQKKLKKIGAKFCFDLIYKRKVFDYPDLRLDKNGAWVRVREEGDKIKMSFKKRIGMGDGGAINDKGMEEIEIEVDDFNKAAKILLNIGLIEKHYTENRRIRYKLNNIEFDIDFWPKLKPFLEIEAPSWKKIDSVILLLGLNPKDRKIFSTYQIYKMNRIDCNDYKKMTFKKWQKRADPS